MNMDRQINSKGWIWFIRAWISIPILIWIPFIVAFFFPVRPSESHSSFWIIVALLIAQSLIRDFWYFRSHKLYIPSMINYGILVPVVVFMTIPLVRWFVAGQTAPGPTMSPIVYLVVLATITPYLLFLQFPKSKAKFSTE